jgi:RNA polymerase sigma-70 factor (ECF subfamily)
MPTFEADLAALVTGAALGDTQAKRTLATRLGPPVLRYCRARLRRSCAADQPADDAARTICLAVVSALLVQGDEGSPFEALVFGTAARTVVDARQEAVRGGAAQAARDLFAQMPEQLRELMVLRVAVGLSLEETGRALGMSAAAVRAAQHMALDQLRAAARQSDPPGG